MLRPCISVVHKTWRTSDVRTSEDLVMGSGTSIRSRVPTAPIATVIIRALLSPPSSQHRLGRAVLHLTGQRLISAIDDRVTSSTTSSCRGRPQAR